MKEIEEMSSDEDDFAVDGADEDDDDAAPSRYSRNKRAAASDLRGGRGTKKVTRRAGGSTFASADDFGAEVDDWHAQLIQVLPSPYSTHFCFAPRLFTTQHLLIPSNRQIERRRLHLPFRSSKVCNSVGGTSAAEHECSCFCNCKILPTHI